MPLRGAAVRVGCAGSEEPANQLKSANEHYTKLEGVLKLAGTSACSARTACHPPLHCTANRPLPDLRKPFCRQPPWELTQKRRPARCTAAYTAGATPTAADFHIWEARPRPPRAMMPALP